MTSDTEMLRPALALALVDTLANPALAATERGQCTVTPKGVTVEPAKRDCWFYQSQGYVQIGYIDEDAFLDLTPVAGVGNYVDAKGKPVYRKKGLGDKGLSFQGEFGLVRFYWAV